MTLKDAIQSLKLIDINIFYTLSGKPNFARITTL